VDRFAIPHSYIRKINMKKHFTNIDDKYIYVTIIDTENNDIRNAWKFKKDDYKLLEGVSLNPRG
tara:strand:- start:2001 stop:2192 length:192 start_codon:yes stop_codon:yes gene_type:complete